MAASNPGGQMRFWFKGFPFNGILRTGYDAGQMRYWFNGFPLAYIGPSSTAPTIKTLAALGVG